MVSTKENGTGIFVNKIDIFFIATSEGSIPMAESEELYVIELDQGDGWTRVRRMVSGNMMEEGFVPTSYIESTLYA